jgi:hypothetical protein
MPTPLSRADMPGMFKGRIGLCDHWAFLLQTLEGLLAVIGPFYLHQGLLCVAVERSF